MINIKDKDFATIYRITNKVNGATYIGQTSLTIEERLRRHFNAKDDELLLHKAMRHFGKENFVIEQIDTTFYRHRFIVEQYYIEQELKKNNMCYNVNVKGESFKETMSLVTKGTKNGMYNRKKENAVNGQKVYMLDDNKNIVKTFNTVGLALEFLGVKSHTQLNKACRENLKYKNYYWEKTFKNI